ncbi:MAG: hypothetical protein JSS83_08525 [Cyanobacteria bacterium SZAS LIN-3]|nr:hypothetical protein [Cyanobacteria bacterium SZAS LIN-3]
MSYPADMPPQSGPHPQAQPNPHGGLAKLVGSVTGNNLNISRSVWKKVDMAYRQIKSMGDSAGTIFNSKAINKAPTAEQLTARARQSDKILVRLLALQGRYPEVARIAAGTDCEEIANLAIMRLMEADQDQVDLIEDLARGNNRATALALFGLLNTGYINLAEEIFVQRMHDGGLCAMVQRGLTTAFTLIALAGRLDQSLGKNYSRVYFDPVFAAVSQNPRELQRFLGELLGDPDPLGGRCVSSPCQSVPQEIKLMAISLSNAFDGPVRERCLCYAAADTDEVVARLATTLLIDYWGSADGCLPPGLQPFAMLNMTLLFHLCNMSASFKWPAPVDFDFYDREVDVLNQELERLDLRYDEPRQKAIQLRLEGIAREVEGIIERRMRSLQNLVNGISTMLNLPNAQLEVGEGSFMAAYIIGRGRIKVAHSLFLDDEPLSVDLMSTLLHEIGHMEQDVLVMRLMADDLGLVFGQHSRHLRPLMERYADAIGYAPDPMFLLAVLRLRNDTPLSTADRYRAERLIDASYETEQGHQTARLMETRIQHLEKSQETLLSGAFDSQLLTCLADRRTIESLFRQGQIPAVVLEEIADCQLEFVEVMHAFLTRRYEDVVFVRPSTKNPDALPMALIGGRRHQLVDLAQRTMRGASLEPLLWIVERLKHLLVEVLKEEQKILRLRLTDIRRAGYHEEEAYVISDRAEVIVRALRQGWYRVT